MDLCRRCDVFVGFGGAGIARQPEGKSVDWLASHCWVCHRSRDEVRERPR
jgi:hypothetical protein